MPRRSRTRTLAVFGLLISLIVFVAHHHTPFLPHPSAVRDHAKDLLQTHFSPGTRNLLAGDNHGEGRIQAAVQMPISPPPIEQSSGTSIIKPHPALQLSDGPLYIFAFGDSYTTYNFETSLAPPSPSNPQGNRVEMKLSDCPQGQQLSTCTYKWLDFLLLDSHFRSKSSSPNLLAWNFGRGASTIDPDIVPPNFWGAKALVDQSKEFLSTVNDPTHAQHVPWSAKNSLVVIFFGINDVANTAEQAAVDHNALYTRALGSYLKVMQELYESGVRNFLLLGLPPLDRTPMLLRVGPPHTHAIAGATAIFNRLLDGLVEDEFGRKGFFAASHLDARVKVLETQSIFHKVLDAEPQSAKCAGNEGTECLWVDQFHPGEKIQRAIGVEVAKAIGEMLIA